MTIPTYLKQDSKLQNTFSTLQTTYHWRAVTSVFKDRVPSREVTSNVHVVPFVGDRVVLIHAKESGWGPTGGTLLEGEDFATCLTRELAEEIGGRYTAFTLFGQWDSTSSEDEPYRPWLPHPNFAIALGWAEVVISGSSADDGGKEMETIREISILPLRTAVDRLRENGEQHLAAIYELASHLRRSS